MAIERIVIHVRSLNDSVEFYRDLLGGVVIGAGDGHADLDFVTAVIELRTLPEGRPTTRQADERVRGFRHIGFKVRSADATILKLDEAGVEFRSRAQDIDALDVRIAFFFDPDGTLLELVERHLDYPIVHSAEAIAEERLMPAPDRPRFDHIGFTVDDLGAARGRYEALGFAPLGAAVLDPETGFRIDFLRHEGTVLEVFSYSVHTPDHVADPRAFGFAAIALPGEPAGSSAGTLPDGRRTVVDPDGLTVLAGAVVR